MEEKRNLLVADRLDITELLARINQSFDDFDADGFASQFALDSSMTGGPAHAREFARGADELRQRVIDSRKRPPHRHYTTNVVITPLGVDGTRAAARSHFIYVEFVEGAPRVKITGIYEDVLVREDDRWKVEERVAHQDRAVESSPSGRR